MNPLIPLAMRIVILFDWRMEYFLCLIGPKNSRPKLNWMTIYSQFSLALEGWKGHWLKQRISKLSLDKGNKLKEGHGGLPRERVWCVCEKKEKRGGSVRNFFFSSYVWRGVHGKGVCNNQIWKEVVCNKYL
jgi:hypothetical protein